MASLLISDPNNHEQWKNSVIDYQNKKKTLEWGENVKPEKITHKLIKQRDTIFNPILQNYNDNNYESKVRSRENEDLIHTLSKNKDRALRYEQTYNLINLNDKLQVFREHPDYPKEKSNIRQKKQESTKANYNILSNYSMKEHHFDCPEKRPNLPEIESKSSQKINAVNFSEYDVISNKYKEFHEEKTKTNLEIQKLAAAKKYWSTHNYDPIQARFIDDNKETLYQEKIKEKQKDWGKNQVNKLPPSVKGEGLLYNPVNMQVVDNDGLKKADLAAKNKKKRYEKRYELETYYKSRDITQEDKKETAKLRRHTASTSNNKECSEFNIYNKKNDNKENNSKKLTPWEKIVENAGANKTLDQKEIWKDPYDYSDNNKKRNDFMNERDGIVKSLPGIEKDNIFGNKTVKNQVAVFSENKEKESKEKNIIDKSNWFNDEKKERIFHPHINYGKKNALERSRSNSNSRKLHLFNDKRILQN